LAKAEIVDPAIKLTHTKDLTFTMSAKGGVGVYAWIDHPEGTVGYFVDSITGVPTNGVYLVPGMDRTREFSFMSMGWRTG
jgi:beta-mannosidase